MLANRNIAPVKWRIKIVALNSSKKKVGETKVCGVGNTGVGRRRRRRPPIQFNEKCRNENIIWKIKKKSKRNFFRFFCLFFGQLLVSIGYKIIKFHHVCGPFVPVCRHFAGLCKKKKNVKLKRR